MDKITRYPIEIIIADGRQLVDGIRNIHYSNIHSKSILMPQIVGTKEHKIENISFSDCSFKVYDGNDIENLETHGYGFVKELSEPQLKIKDTKNVVFNNTTFDAEI